jgi:8-oxo-dGTP pyrophosphatase MutT (NUDIX family)
MSEQRGPWTVEKHRLVYENPWMSVVEHEVIRPDGRPGLYGVMSPKHVAIAILPVRADGSVVLVGQHRFALDAYSWELPEGGGDKGDIPVECAARELREETGYRAERWQEVLRMDLSNSITDEQAIGYLATDLTAGDAEPEGTEVLTVREVHFREAVQEVAKGEITDALTVAMLYRAYYMAQQGELDRALAHAMLQR